MTEQTVAGLIEQKKIPFLRTGTQWMAEAPSVSGFRFDLQFFAAGDSDKTEEPTQRRKDEAQPQKRRYGEEDKNGQIM